MTESLIIAWEEPTELIMKRLYTPWAKNVRKEIRKTPGKRMKWALVANDDNAVDFKGKREAAEKVFGYFNTKWDVRENKLYVRLPWWKL